MRSNLDRAHDVISCPSRTTTHSSRRVAGSSTHVHFGWACDTSLCRHDLWTPWPRCYWHFSSANPVSAVTLDPESWVFTIRSLPSLTHAQQAQNVRERREETTRPSPVIHHRDNAPACSEEHTYKATNLHDNFWLNVDLCALLSKYSQSRWKWLANSIFYWE